MRIFWSPRFFWRQCLMLCIVAAYSASGSTKEAPMVIKYPMLKDVSEARQAYKLELIKLILEQTKAEYGTYLLEHYVINDPGANRLALILDKGDQVNLWWSSPGSIIAQKNVIEIPVDILHGQLGHRICLINRESKIDLSNVTDLNAFKSIRIGQGLGWADVDIYSFNGFNPILASSFDGLIGMLAANRFDCVPLGINEIEAIYQEKLSTTPQLLIEPNLQIDYAFPIYFYVSARFPKIAERLKNGFKTIQANGEFKTLFNKYFPQNFENLNLEKRRVICLKSPYLPLEKQCQPIK